VHAEIDQDQPRCRNITLPYSHGLYIFSPSMCNKEDKTRVFLFISHSHDLQIVRPQPIPCSAADPDLRVTCDDA
jgi:hypothetical protein